MNKKKSKGGDLVFKLDLEKVYDMANWNFLKETLIMFGFPQILVDIVMLGITSSLVSLLSNGSKIERFNPRRGLRQGNIISPYLFVLCMERFREMISKAIREVDWLPIQITKYGSMVSHIFSTDDVVLFTQANVAEGRAAKKVLDKFCAIPKWRLV